MARARQWNLYHCSVTADILTETAAAMVKTGLKDAGYIYVNRRAPSRPSSPSQHADRSLTAAAGGGCSDDCWMAFNRSADGSQLPDPSKFPKGFKAVADAIHGMGMKSGL